MKKMAILWLMMMAVNATAWAQAAPAQPPAGQQAAPATAPNQSVDFWRTRQECEAATTAPTYRPSFLSQVPLAPGQTIQNHPTGGCFHMDLPDRQTRDFPTPGYGWVRIEQGRPFVYQNGAVVSLADCRNKVIEEVSFLIPAPPGANPPVGLNERTDVTGSDTTAQTIREMAERQALLQKELDALKQQAGNQQKQEKQPKVDDGSGFPWTPVIITGIIAGTVYSVCKWTPACKGDENNNNNHNTNTVRAGVGFRIGF